MPRCEHDTVLFRVFCVTLLAVALAFTLILTNVFIDIDSLLTTKEKERAEQSREKVAAPASQGQEDSEVMYQLEDSTPEPRTEAFYDYHPDADEDDSTFRTKRSLDSKDFQYHLKNPKMKEVLTNKLATLLEEMDVEEMQSANKVYKNKNQDNTPMENLINPRKSDDKNTKDNKSHDDLLHLAMHNILLQGIIGHMDFNDVYKKIHMIMKNFDLIALRSGDEYHKESKKKNDVSKELELSESKFFEELLKCEELQKQIAEATKNRDANAKNTLLNYDEAEALSRRSYGGRATITTNNNNWDTYREAVEKKTPHMLIKTVIDIKTLKTSKNKTINENNVKGLIKFIYNGKPIKFSGLENDDDENKLEISETKTKKDDRSLEREKEAEVIQQEIGSEKKGNLVDKFLDNAIAAYLKKHPKLENQFKAKRMKRSVKIKVKDAKTENPKVVKKKEDEEVYVEIETHFDAKGEKKKKLIKSLVEKIQKAINANISTMKSKKKVEITKRAQSPLKNQRAEVVLKNKISIPLDPVEHRDLYPIISKTAKFNEALPKVYDDSGQIWKRMYKGSGFLSNNKAINSGEGGGLVDLDYSTVMKHSGIPQRLLQPINTDNIGLEEGAIEDGNFFNIGDLKFYIKEIDGTGFSIGFNQYVGEAPDPASIKLFTGLQQLIRTYHQNYDENDGKSETSTAEKEKNETDANHEMRKRDVNTLYSDILGQIPEIKNGDHQHVNEYRVIFDNQYLPYDTYSEIFEDQDKKVQLAIKKDDTAFRDSFTEHHKVKKTEIPLVVDGNLFDKNLKPSEIFGIASLLERRKRSPTVKVKKFSSLSTRKRSRFNRYINTNRKTSRILVSQNKRIKRQVDKIRIIATDTMPDLQGQLDENDNVYVLSDEAAAARNNLHDVEMVDNEDAGQEEVVEPQMFSEPQHPLFNEYSKPQQYNVFASRSRHNALMSKYPHLFLEAIGKSKENDDPPVFYNKLINSYTDFQNRDDNTTPSFLGTPVALPEPSPILRQLPSEVLDNIPRSNYKLTVKVSPKNHTELGSGFKEVHTSINKSIHRNGVVYSSLVNVSELSKVENLPTTSTYKPYLRFRNTQAQDMPEVTDDTKTSVTTSYYPLVRHIREQQEKMKMLLKQHKKRIDDELNTLKKEKQSIESIIPAEKKDMIDVVLPLNPPQMLHLNRNEAGQLITSALMKLHDAPQLNDIASVANTSVLTTIDIPTTTQPAPTAEPEKVRILKSIQRNENLTNAILHKIDRNTNMLQSFLQKLTDRLTEPSSMPRYEHRKSKPHVSDPFLGQVLPNMEMQKINDTPISIPFVYAYQQPYPMPSKANNQVASVVYQGHIHTNALHKPSMLRSDEKVKVPTGKREANHTRFFFDSVLLEDKEPLLHHQKSYDIPRVKTNITLGKDY